MSSVAPHAKYKKHSRTVEVRVCSASTDVNIQTDSNLIAARMLLADSVSL